MTAGTKGLRRSLKRKVGQREEHVENKLWFNLFPSKNYGRCIVSLRITTRWYVRCDL